MENNTRIRHLHIVRHWKGKDKIQGSITQHHCQTLNRQKNNARLDILDLCQTLKRKGQGYKAQTLTYLSDSEKTGTRIRDSDT